MCPEGDVHRDLRSAQFCERLGIQNQEESAFLLHAGPDMGTVTGALYLIVANSAVVLAFLGVMTTDRTAPSSSSTAPGDATKTGSEGYRPG